MKKQLCLNLKDKKILIEAIVNVNPIHLTKPNTTSPLKIIEEELTVLKGITFSNVSTSPALQTLDLERDIPRSDLSGEVR